MRNLKEAHQVLVDLHYELDTRSNSLGDKLERVGSFIDKELEDVANEVDTAIDRIKELEEELSEAKEAAEEWEEKYNALV